MKNLFDEAMSGIGEKVALQEIRKVLRGSLTEKGKLEAVVDIVQTYVDYAERRDAEAENRELAAEEAELRRQRIDDAFGAMKEPLDKLTLKG